MAQSKTFDDAAGTFDPAFADADFAADFAEETGPTQAGSILAADFGSVTTRVVLVEVVEGAYRLVARSQGRTTIGFPIDDVSVGLARLVRDIGRQTGRTFYAGDSLIMPEGIDRNGVDALVATATAGRPMRLALVGLMADFSMRSAQQALAGAFVEIVAAVHLDDGQTPEDRLNALLLSRPDLIVIVGGTDAGAQRTLRQMVSLVKLALEVAEDNSRPLVLYAGNRALSEEVSGALDTLTQVIVADNVRPSMDEEYYDGLRNQLNRATDLYNEQQGGSFRRLRTTANLVPTGRSYALVADYLARVTGQRVLALDMGSASTLLVAALDGEIDTQVEANYGVGHGAPGLLERVGVEAVQRWLPFAAEPLEIRNYALNKSLRPASVPVGLRDLYIEHALLRAGLRHLIDNARSHWPGINPAGSLNGIDLILAGGSPLTATGSPGFNLLLITDVARPDGMTEVLADPNGVIPALGAIANISPEAVAQLLEGDSLERLGTVLSVSGEPPVGKPIAKMKITTEDNEVYDQELIGGDVLLLPLPPGRRLTLDIRLTRGLTLAGKRRFKRVVMGGVAGVLIDGRGRPLMPSADVTVRAGMLPLWVHQAADVPLHNIPERWLYADKDGQTPDQGAGAGTFDEAQPYSTQDEAFLEEFGVDVDEDLRDLLSDDDEFPDDVDDDDLRALRNL